MKSNIRIGLAAAIILTAGLDRAGRLPVAVRRIVDPAPTSAEPDTRKRGTGWGPNTLRNQQRQGKKRRNAA